MVIHVVEAAASSINNNLMGWVIDLLVHQIQAPGIQTTPRGRLLMSEEDLATISINSNPMRSVIDLVELQILVL